MGKVHLTNVEALGGGTLVAYGPVNDQVAPRIHVTVGLKEHADTGHTSHLLGATVQFLTEMLVIKVAAPRTCTAFGNATSTTSPFSISSDASIPGHRLARLRVLEGARRDRAAPGPRHTARRTNRRKPSSHAASWRRCGSNERYSVD